MLVEFPTSLTAEAVARFEAREDIAAVAALRMFLSPRSVAVIGASRHRGTIGGELFHNLLENGFAGPVYPVNPGAEVVQSVRAYATVDDLPEPVDLAVVAVPAESVADVARACGARGVRGLVVISAGFAEAGERGARASARARWTICRATRDAADRPELHGDRQHRSGREAERHVRSAVSAARRDRVPLAERRARPGGDGLRAGARASGSRRSSRWATRPTSPATTCSRTGRRTPTPTWCCCTSSRSAILAGSPASPAGSAARSRSSP